MIYAYILISKKLHKFYFGHTTDLRQRLLQHNGGQVIATKSGRTWELAWYGAFSTLNEAKSFEKYLKSGSGKAFDISVLFLTPWRKISRVEEKVFRS